MIESIELVRNLYPDEVYISGGVDQSAIDMAQNYLNCVFPQRYSEFLNDYGSFSFFGFEILGILGTNFESSVITDSIRTTIYYRRKGLLEDNLIAIYDDNGDVLHILQAGDSEDSGVFVWDLSSRSIVRTFSTSFVEYTNDRIETAIQNLSQDLS
ncbi:SMI1/KNR4 family protein [Deinococcus sp.]|uniref:SMI1/KNR4 family protein n=1 Tax=Deinococcus sp. TaxID=47478 RepID=UPI003CC62B46